MTLGELLCAALTKQAAPEDALVPAATGLIASHYGLHPEEVEETLWDIAADMAERGGSIFGPMQTPHGFTTLGVMVAQRLLGGDETAEVPLLTLSIH
jgi:hypothetical protein